MSQLTHVLIVSTNINAIKMVDVIDEYNNEVANQPLKQWNTEQVIESLLRAFREIMNFLFDDEGEI